MEERTSKQMTRSSPAVRRCPTQSYLHNGTPCAVYWSAARGRRLGRQRISVWTAFKSISLITRQQAVAQYLLDCGADIHWIGHQQKTPLDVSIESNNEPFIQWLKARVAHR
jgi:hypothetical protein